jgi:hypothetical protein
MRIGKFIKSVAVFTILFCLAISVTFGQKRKPSSSKPAPKKQIAAPKPIAEISAAEWSAIVSALEKEDWTQAERLTAASLGKLKTDNDKKQLAQLRYFYLYALAGRAAGGKMAHSELEKIAAGFVGKEFLMPSREFLSVCQGNLNYICPVKSNEKMLRVTATNKSGSAIHSFEYIQLAEKFDFTDKNGKSALVGGILKETEINLYKSSIPIMRLIFDRGFVNIVASR